MKLYWNEIGLMYTWENVEFKKKPKHTYLWLQKATGPCVHMGFHTWSKDLGGGNLQIPSQLSSLIPEHWRLCTCRSKKRASTWCTPDAHTHYSGWGMHPSQGKPSHLQGVTGQGRPVWGCRLYSGSLLSGCLTNHQGLASSPALWGLRSPCA